MREEGVGSSGPSLINVWKTARRVIAFGYRTNEIPIVIPKDLDCEADEGMIPPQGASISLPCYEKERGVTFRRLDEGYVEGFGPISVDYNHLQSVRHGFNKRLLRQVPQFEHKELYKIRKFVKKWLRENVAKVVRLSFEEWLEGTSYNMKRKEELTAVQDGLNHCRPTLRKCKRVSTFVKREHYNEFKHARLINSRCDAFKVFSGPYFKAIEHELYKRQEFIKNIPIPDRPALIKQLVGKGKYCYQTDYTAYESHFSSQIMDAIECELYRHCLSNYPDDAEFICKVLTGTNKMRTRTGISARVIARRMSGDMCTSLGNGFTNLMLTKYLCDVQGKELHGFVEGDDGLFVTDAILDGSMYEKLGFTIKMEKVSDPCHASFCGMIFGESEQIIKDPRGVFNGFGWTSSFLSAGPKIMHELARAKALSLCYELPHCPVLRPLADLSLRKTRGYLPRFDENSYRYHMGVYKDEARIPPFAPTMQTRELFYDKFGISIKTQIEVETLIREDRLNEIHRYIEPTYDQELYCQLYVEPT